MFTLPSQPPLAFKGGTSLSKVYNAIHRFSEDIDITVHYAHFNDAIDPFGTPKPSGNKLKEHRERVEETHLPKFIDEVVLPHLRKAANALGRHAPTLTVEHRKAHIVVHYPSVLSNMSTVGGYLPERVLIELGGRNTTEPTKTHTVRPYLAELADLQAAFSFPSASVNVVSAERTFWEKVTAIHAFLTHKEASTKLRSPERLSRHWYDLAMLSEHPIGQRAIRNQSLRDSVILTKQRLFSGGGVDYNLCTQGQTVLCPSEPEVLEALRQDYLAMINSGMFSGNPPAFADIMTTLQTLQGELNRV